MTDPKACGAYEGDYSALIDGELAPAREALVQAHLAGCEPCRANFAALRDVDLALAELSRPALPGDLRSRLQARIERPGPRPSRGRAPGVRRRWLSGSAAAAAVAATLAAIVYLAPAAPESPDQETPVVIASASAAGSDPAAIPEIDDPRPAAAAPDGEAIELELESFEDLDVIANLELLEAFVALDGGTG